MTVLLHPDRTTEADPAQGGRWIRDWRPEDADFWESGGKDVARRNLWMSVLTEHVGFSVWAMWSVLVLFLGPEYGFVAADKFLIVTVPALVGAFVRLPYTFAVAVVGGRNWTVLTAGALLVPLLLMLVVLEPGVSLTTVLLCAAVAGIGGGNFASSMANINAFYPDRHKGWALGLNAGAGNLGVSAVQLVGLLVLTTVGAGSPRFLVALYVPLVVLATVLAWRRMDNLRCVRNDRRGIRDAVRQPHTWCLSLLYVGTFGSFIGFGFAFGQVLLVQFPDRFPEPVSAASLTFLGPLLGSLARPYGGKLADRFGGADVTLTVFAAMALSAAGVLLASRQDSLPLFVAGFTGLFLLSGIGNGSTYKMIPVTFRNLAAAVPDRAAADARRLTAAVIGIAGAVGALGGVLVSVSFRESFLRTGSGDAAYLAFLGFYGVCALLTWTVYLRSAQKADAHPPAV